MMVSKPVAWWLLMLWSPDDHKERGAEADPVAVVGQLQGRHPGIDVLGLVGQRVERVVADDPVKGMVDVETVDVPVARPAEIGGVDRVRLKDPDRIGPDQEAVVVELEAGLVMVVSGR